MLPEADQVDLRSAGGPGAAGWLLAPVDARHRMPDDHFVVALRRRLRFAHPAVASVSGSPSHCQHRRPDGSVCGDLLDSRGHHGATCEIGGGVEFGHDAIRDWLAAWIEEVSGSRPGTEQWVSAWDTEVQAKDAQGRPRVDAQGTPIMTVRHAKLDVAFVDRESRRCYIDVVVTAASSSSAELRAARAAESGAAARDAVRAKRAKYRAEKNPTCPLVPFAIESLGRLSDEALGLIRSVVPPAEAIGQGARSRAIRHAQQSLSVLVQVRLSPALRPLLSCSSVRRLLSCSSVRREAASRPRRRRLGCVAGARLGCSGSRSP